ncbi:Serine/threonine-protein phosphatase 2B catalytic subunit alpha isoform [Astathelohania contejeani]|uniref:Serine/threonine-protein phosphatase n=1 Tax=Astathelohania contejeani TaxID=164912 RepID=A0ABQ7I0C1_9MICR|nr:Serine/threonine-protein phosphatase 2B catalytic subunit alpha isoform [Thelohania contejeani]
MNSIEVEEYVPTDDETNDIPLDTKKRTLSFIPEPASHRIEMEYLLDQRVDLLDYRVIKSHFHNEGRLTEFQINKIFEDSLPILKLEPNLLEIDGAVTIIGDIHGQFYDLETILTKVNLAYEKILFLGDYVDRGYFSIEVYLFLLLLKSHFPKRIFLLRGNHESAQMTKYFTFREECKQKYSIEVYDKCVKSFRCLPIAAVVSKKIFCVHGGISPTILKTTDINKFNRNAEPKSLGLFCDLLWSDPHPDYNGYEGDEPFLNNLSRRCSYYYTKNGVREFLKKNDLMCIVRGHEVQDKGYKFYQPIFENQPSIITIFSAPNYCDAYNNQGAILKFEKNQFKIIKFRAVAHPYTLPNFMDAINWSFPFISEKLSELFLDILKVCHEKEIASSSDSTVETSEALPIKEEIVKTEKFTNSMAIMREERENFNELEDEESEFISPCKLKFIENEDCGFNEAKEKDSNNEAIVEDINIVKGISITGAPSAVPPITKKMESLELGGVIEESKIIVEENVQSLVLKGPRKKINPTFNLWCCFGGE